MSEEQAEPDPGTADYVTFDMEGAPYAFPMSRVQEIIRMPAVVRVPLGPPSLEGLSNLRGRILPVVSLRTSCSLPEIPHDEATRVIVVDGGVPLGFVVDRVSSVVSVEDTAVEAADSVQSTVGSDVLVGVIKSGDGQMTTVLDVDRLVGAQFARLAAARDAVETKTVSVPSAEDDTAADPLELVSFAVDGQEYALPIDQVQEIVQAPDSVNRIPNSGSRVLGVIDLRGRLLPVVSMRRIFGLPVGDLEPQNRIVVVSIDGGVVGMVMDTVRQVLRVPRDLVAPLPAAITAGGRSSEVEAVCRLEDGKRLVSVLSVNRMFDSPEIRSELAAQLKDEATEPTEPTKGVGEMVQVDDSRGDEELFVVFHLDGEEYAVEVDRVQEIIRVPEALIRVPKTFDFVEGLVNLRGTVLPVVDLRIRLGVPRAEPDERQRIVVLVLGGTRTGFVVDSVAEVARVPKAALEPAPELSDEQARIVSRVANLPEGDRMLLVVQVDQLLSAEQTTILSDVPADEAFAAV